MLYNGQKLLSLSSFDVTEVNTGMNITVNISLNTVLDTKASIHVGIYSNFNKAIFSEYFFKYKVNSNVLRNLIQFCNDAIIHVAADKFKDIHKNNFNNLPS